MQDHPGPWVGSGCGWGGGHGAAEAPPNSFSEVQSPVPGNAFLERSPIPSRGERQSGRPCLTENQPRHKRELKPEEGTVFWGSDFHARPAVGGGPEKVGGGGEEPGRHLREKEAACLNPSRLPPAV